MLQGKFMITTNMYANVIVAAVCAAESDKVDSTLITYKSKVLYKTLAFMILMWGSLVWYNSAVIAQHTS